MLDFVDPRDVDIPADYDGPDVEPTTRDAMLCDSIVKFGIRNPIFLSPTGAVWDGVRRVTIARRFGIDLIPYVAVPSIPFAWGRPTLFRVINRLNHEIAEVLKVVKQSEDESATGRPGVRSDSAIDALNRWRVLEEATGYSRDWLTAGYQLFNRLHVQAGRGDEEAMRAISTFRNYGLAAALRLLDKPCDLPDDGHPDPAVNRLDYGGVHLVKPRVARVETTDQEHFLNAIAVIERQFPEGATFDVESAINYLRSVAEGIDG